MPLRIKKIKKKHQKKAHLIYKRHIQPHDIYNPPSQISDEPFYCNAKKTFQTCAASFPLFLLLSYLLSGNLICRA